MFDLSQIKATSTRNRKAVELRPSLARGTQIAKATMGENLRCDIDVDGVKVCVQMPEYCGGKGGTPGPGVHALSALLSCLTIGYVMKFAELDLPLSGVSVEAHADYDSSNTPYSGIRYSVTIESEAPEEEIMRAIDEGDAHSYGLGIFRCPISMQRDVRITSPT